MLETAEDIQIQDPEDIQIQDRSMIQANEEVQREAELMNELAKKLAFRRQQSKDNSESQWILARVFILDI